ncbi:MAG: cold shock CspA family protein [Candidatus Aldehydirespiratoraceae bacterium]|jgi:cold shock CspA family protein
MSRHSSDSTRQGRVHTYDDAAGYGTILEDAAENVAAENVAGEWFFHCTAIADGSRTIATEQPVSFALIPGHLGRYEATDIRSV